MGLSASYTHLMNRSLYLVPRQPSRRERPLDLKAMCARAIEYHQRGKLAEAERIYHQILEVDPRHADSLHLLGVLAHQIGRDEIAIKLISRAIAVDRRPAAFHSNLGTALQAMGRLGEAVACYERALAINPLLAEAEMNLGAVLEAQGKHDLAEAHIRATLELRPDLAEVHVNLGNILQAQGKLEEAVASHERAIALQPGFAEAFLNYANTLQAQGKLDDAVAGYKKAIDLKPGMAEAYGNLGNALLAQNQLDEADARYQQALALKPNYAEAHYNQGNLRQAQGRLPEAATCYEHAIALKPELAEAHYNLGNTLHALDLLDDAEASFKRALARRPEYAEAHYNLGCVLEDLGRLEEAMTSIGRALEIRPDFSRAGFGLALAQLRDGDFATGWRNYESRWQSPDHDTPRRAYRQPLWAGEKLATGRLLLWGEQGVGDQIMFAGLLPQAIRSGNQIVLDCDARLEPLFARSFPQIEVVSGRQPADVGTMGIAAHMPTGSLPGIFRASQDAFAATVSPYLRADRTEAEQFRTRYSDGRRLIGLAWYTRNQKTGRKRCIGLESFAPLFALPGIRWISLQYGDFDRLEQEAAAAHAPLLIDRSVDQFADIDRFAAQIAALDQVVTIDNSTAHLAGALGLPVWLLLPFAADWRWLEKRSDSPWYPTLRLLRQSKIGDWGSVVESLLKDIRLLPSMQPEL